MFSCEHVGAARTANQAVCDEPDAARDEARAGCAESFVSGQPQLHEAQTPDARYDAAARFRAQDIALENPRAER
jgi:hypothetical protein